MWHGDNRHPDSPTALDHPEMKPTDYLGPAHSLCRPQAHTARMQDTPQDMSMPIARRGETNATELHGLIILSNIYQR
jgi:hypothetical protein